MTNNIKLALVLIVLIFIMLAAVFFINTARFYFEKTFIQIFPVSYTKLWGAFTGNTASSLVDFQQQIGKRVDLNAVFVGWGDQFPFEVANVLKPNNQTLFIFWEQNSATLDEIISGQNDEYIKQFAEASKDFNGKIIIAPLHEMNGNWNAWGGTVGNNTPEKVISAFQHMHDLFIDAPNIKWAWVVNNVSVPDSPQNAITNYYPGNKYVDYVGIDGFNFGDPWQSYSEIFSKPLQQVRQYKKPIIIASIASAQGEGKSIWIKDALLSMQNDPDIVGFIWFNENKEKNWLLSSDQKSLEEFKKTIK